MLNKAKKLIIKYRQFVKFGIVGASGTLIDFFLLNLLVWAGVNVYISATLSFLAAASSNFYFNKVWTFRFNGEKKVRVQYLQFLIVSTIGLLINLAIMYVLIEKFSLWYNWAKLSAVLVVTWWNYMANKYWTFVDKKGSDNQENNIKSN